VHLASPAQGRKLLRYSSLSPDDLVKACAGSRDPAVWQAFIRLFQPVIAAAVLRTARRFGELSRHTLDDLVQETYLKLCEDDSRLLRSFVSRHPDAIFGFLKVVAGNVVHDYFKSALAEKRGAGQTDALPDCASPSTPVSAGYGSAAMERQILLRQIDDALVAAGEDKGRNRLIFWLHYRDGLTASAIASLPGIDLTTKGVESILLRMTRMIRSHMTSAEKPQKVAKT
jgi:RNA polymerase sigma-70 factor (ECF subfamily)